MMRQTFNTSKVRFRVVFDDSKTVKEMLSFNTSKV